LYSISEKEKKTTLLLKYCPKLDVSAKISNILQYSTTLRNILFGPQSNRKTMNLARQEAKDGQGDDKDDGGDRKNTPPDNATDKTLAAAAAVLTNAKRDRPRSSSSSSGDDTAALLYPNRPSNPSYNEAKKRMRTSTAPNDSNKKGATTPSKPGGTKAKGEGKVT
jgi:hypothetical protein